MKLNKFVIGGVLILGAVAFLIWSATASPSEYFLTIDELKADGTSVMNRNLRVSGAVIGDTIQYDAQNLTLTFEVAHVPADNAALTTEGGLAQALHEASIIFPSFLSTRPSPRPSGPSSGTPHSESTASSAPGT